MTTQSLSVNMKSALALMASWVTFLLVGLGASAVSGPLDIYGALSLVFAIPYLVFLYYGLKLRPWAYLAGSALSVFVIILAALMAPIGMPEIVFVLWIFAVLLSALVAMEAFKAYLECRVAR